MSDPLIFVNVRDRVTPLRELVDWLERAGHQRIVLLDNASTWEPCVEYLEQTPHAVVALGHNVGARSLWDGHVPNEPFVFTDPDIVPTDECPLDAVDHLARLLGRHPQWPKAALGLYLDDVPTGLPSLPWERSLVTPGARLVGSHLQVSELEPGAYGTLSDTTFALYRPSCNFDLRAIRTGAPYQARHTSWYARELDEEDRYYLERAMGGPHGSSWRDAA